MKLLVEKDTNFETECLIEGTDGGPKSYYINGIFLQSEIKNRNGRVYPKSVLVNEVARYSKAKIETDQAVGELGHPDSPTINLDRLSHKIISLKEDGNNFIGKAKILSTPFGKIVQNLIEDGVKFGVSSRCLGSLKESNGVNIVCSDLFMITPADIVSDPSAPDAFVTAVMENKEWVWENDRLIEKECEIKKIVNKEVKKNKLDEENLLRIFEYILNQI